MPSEESVNLALTSLEKIVGDFRNDKEWSPALVDGPRVLGVESMFARWHGVAHSGAHHPESKR